MKTAALILLAIFCAASAAASTNYYIDSSGGNDGNTGASPQLAWRTLGALSRRPFQPGDQILLRRGGLWREELTIASSGKAGAPIRVNAYGEGPLPIISGADLIDPRNWTPCRDCQRNVWQISLAQKVNVVMYQGRKGTHVDSRDALNREGDWLWDDGVLFVTAAAGSSGKQPPPLVEAGARSSGIDLTGVSFVSVQNVRVQAANAIAYGSGAGIWAAAPHLSGPPPHDLQISHVVVEDCAGDGIHLENASGTAVADSVVTDNENAGIVLYGSIGAFPITSAEISGNDVHGNHFTGINIIGCPRGTRCRSVTYPQGIIVKGLRITQNRVHDNGAGIYLHQTDSSLVANNLVYANTDPSRRGEGYCVGLSGSSSNVVEKNECVKSRFAAIELSIDIGKPPLGSSNNIIRYNVIHDSGTHGLFTNYAPSQNNEFAYNLVYDNPNGACFLANFIGHNFHNNTCYNNREGIHLYVSKTTTKTGNISIANNLIIRSKEHAVLIDAGADLPNDFRNNDYYPDAAGAFETHGRPMNFQSWRSSSGFDSNSIIADPLFRNNPPTQPVDFQLSPASPAIGKGIPSGMTPRNALSPSAK